MYVSMCWNAVFGILFVFFAGFHYILNMAHEEVR